MLNWLSRSLTKLSMNSRTRARIWPLGLYLLLSAAGSWTIWLWPLKLRGGFSVTIFGIEYPFPHSIIPLLAGSCLPGVLALVWAGCEGKDKLRGIWSTLVRWKTSAKWYIAAIVLPGIISAFTWVVLVFVFHVKGVLSPPAEFFVILFLNLPFAPLWEEIAWRAFALRRLEARFSPLASATILGVYWGVWHVPLWAVQFAQFHPLSTSDVCLLSASAANVVSWSIIFAFLYVRSSRSLPVVILLHAAEIAAAAQLGLALPGSGAIASYAYTVVSLCVAVLIATGEWGKQPEQGAQGQACGESS